MATITITTGQLELDVYRERGEALEGIWKLAWPVEQRDAISEV